MKPIIIVFLLCSLLQIASARIIIVDINGGGQFTTIQAGINASVAGDTVKVWPGYYGEQVNLNKNITLMGSGYENTVIRGSFNPAVTVSSGAIQWFQITSINGNGVSFTGGTIRNCVVRDCGNSGIASTTGTGTISNCVLYTNGLYGVYESGGATLSVTNCIAWQNTSTGFAEDYYSAGSINLSYSDGSYSNTTGNQGCINTNPQFSSGTDFHIPDGSPCWNTGTTALLDPDGSRSDMGYFGGLECPIYPVITEILLAPSGNTVNLTAKGRANY